MFGNSSDGFSTPSTNSTSSKLRRPCADVDRQLAGERVVQRRRGRRTACPGRTRRGRCPTRSTQYSKCCMNDSMDVRADVRGSAWCAARPRCRSRRPLSAHAFSTSSGFMRRVSHSARAPAWVMKIGLLADLDRVQRRLVAGVRDVDGDAELVHAPHRQPAELGQAAVVLSRAGRSRACWPRCRRCLIERMPSPYSMSSRSSSFSIGVAASSDGMNAIWPFCLARADVLGRFGADDHVLVGDVGQAHAQVPDDVVPLPAGLGGDARRCRPSGSRRWRRCPRRPGPRSRSSRGRRGGTRRSASGFSGTTKAWSCSEMTRLVAAELLDALLLLGG